MASEVNFDGLVGPTHNYAGLSLGNIASVTHKARVSNPLEAALQGLEKMKEVSEMGLAQAVLPPQERPDVHVLRKLGFTGTDAKVLEQAAKQAIEVLTACSSASSMWTANAATISPSADTADKKVHFTPANLANKFHRSIEPETTGAILKAIFKDPKYFVHHDPLPPGTAFGDEGAANHTRLCAEYGKRGVEFFVFGRYEYSPGAPAPVKFPARQTYEASSTIARLHGLKSNSVVFGQQNPAAIDAGVFHNDVASVGNQDFFFYHEQAFLNPSGVLTELSMKFHNQTGKELHVTQVDARKVPLEDAVRSYLFNSQLVTPPEGEHSGMCLIAPMECQEVPTVRDYLESLVGSSQSPIRHVRYFNLRQSMRNGGGPACLRLRVVLSEKERARANPGVFMNAKLYASLVKWVKKHYRDRLAPADLADPLLLKESRAALDELTRILKLGSVYPFQRTKRK